MNLRLAASMLLLLAALAPTASQACACGCGVFSVGTGALLADAKGTTGFVEYGYLDQDRNWAGTSEAPAADNDDKVVSTRFYTVGVQHMFDRSWGVSVMVPYLDRHMSSDETGSLESIDHAGLGDVRVTGRYTGFSPDMSTGLEAGFKLSTGGYTYPGLDRDTSLGTGTTDLLLGAYHLVNLGAEAQWTGFIRGQWSHALAERAGYRPGDELDAALGASYAGWGLGSGSLVPIFQLIAVDRGRDSGSAADAANTGYRKLLASPGLEYDCGPLRLYADIEFTAYQDVSGNQLVASRQYKFVASYRF
jgi:hypothetical protein